MQSSRKQPSRRLEKRENSRRWLLIPALCAAVILAVVLIVELNKQPQVLPDNSNTTPVSHDQPTTPDPEPEPDPEPIPELLTLVNPWNQVPEDWTVDLVTLPNGLEIDKRCYDALMDMIDGCYDAGLHQRAPAGAGGGHCGRQLSAAGHQPGEHRRAEVATGKQLALWLHPALSHGPDGCHWNRV